MVPSPGQLTRKAADGTPLDIFLEIVPILDLAPKVGFDFNGAIGIRYYF
jgi:hypothetical protein